MSEGEWKARPLSRFGLILGQAEAVFLSGDPERAAGLLDDAEALASDDLESASISVIRSRILELRGELYGAINEIRRSLLRLGVSLPETPQDIQKAVGEGIGRLMGGLARSSIESLAELKEMDDRRKAMAMRLLSQAVPSSIQVDYQLYLVETLIMMDLTLSDGLTQESCKAVVDAGILVAAMLGDYETAYRLGKTAFVLIDRLKAEWQRPPVYFSFTYVSHMRKHFHEGLEYFDLSYRKGLELGDMQHAMYAISHKLHLMMWIGADLRDCERENGDAMAFLAESRGFVQLKLAAFFYYLMGETEEAAKWNDMAEGVIFASGTDFPVSDHYLMCVLILIDRLKAGSSGDKDAAIAKIEASLTTLKKWADSCPENFAHKQFLAMAELSAFRREPLETTLGLYRKAAASIGPGDFQQMTALINELEGRFWLERGEEAIGKAFLHEAHY